MALTKAIDIIDRAYALLGVKAAGEPLSGNDSEYGLKALNAMLDSWQISGMYIPYSVTASATITGSTALVGVGQVFDVARPVKINQAFVSDGGIDTPVVMLNEQQYFDTPQKDAPSFGYYAAYYSPTLPHGTLFFTPALSSKLVNLVLDSQLTQFPDYTTGIEIAPAYLHGLQYCLAVELSPGLREVSALVLQQANTAKQNIRRANAKVPFFGDKTLSTRTAFMAGL